MIGDLDRRPRFELRRAARAVALGVALAAVGGIAGGSPALAADRAIELVTPSGSDAEVRTGGGAASLDGEYVCFNGEYAMAGAASNGDVTADDGYCSRRSASGWRTEWVTGPAVAEPKGTTGGQIYFLAADGSRVAFASDMGIFPDYSSGLGAGSFGARSAFMWEGGQTRWLAPNPERANDPRNSSEPNAVPEREPLAASADLHHGIFVTAINLVPQDTNGKLDVYEWTPDGIRVVSRDASGNAVGGYAPITMSIQVQSPSGTVSSDGSRIFFQSMTAGLAGAPGGVLSAFLREGDELTHISPRLGPGPAGDVSFVGATPDGSVAYLTSTEQLTAEPKDAGPAIYRYDVEAGELSQFAAGTDGNGVYFLGVSDDGSTVVYHTGGFLSQLVVRRDGVDATLGELAMLDTFEAFDAVANPRSDKRALRIAADGKAVVFASYAALDGSPGGTRQVYRWTPADGVRWISKMSGGGDPTGPASIGNYTTQVPLPTEPQGRVKVLTNQVRNRPSDGRVISTDGSRVFFETTQRLVAGDVNEAYDVYEWSDGELSLVSPGTQVYDVLYHDNSADGETVFLTTYARLIPELDRNTGSDMYAAREGGGFPLPKPSECSGEACQGDLKSRPGASRPGSAAFDGSGDVRESRQRRARHRVARLSAAQRRALARGGRTALRVRATRRGVLSATARARIGRRDVVVGRSVRAARAGSVARLPLRLSKRARTALANEGRLRLVIKVKYSESGATSRQVVVLGA